MTYPTSICTLDDVHSQLSIPSTDTSNDALLVLYINAATEVINDLTEQYVPAVFTDEAHNGGTTRIKLFNKPILSVDTVTEWVGTTSYPLTETTQGANIGPYTFWVTNPEQGYLTRVWSNMPGPFVGGVDNIVVTYTAGYQTIPDRIKLAVLQDIQVLYQQTKYGSGASPYGSGIGSEVQDNFNVTPINAFPRLAHELSGKTHQAIA